MYLYEKDDNKIKVYSMEPNIDKIFDYKNKEISKIHLKDRTLKFVTNKPIKNIEKTTYINNLVIDLPKKELEYNKRKFFRTEYHEMRNDRLYIINGIIEGYKERVSNDSNIIRVFDYDNKLHMLKYIKYLLVGQEYIKKSEDKNIFELTNVINIPESLYLLEMLCRGNFDMIRDKNVQEQLKLFDISYVDEIHVDEFKKAKNYELLQDGYEKIINNAEETNKIFKLIR